MSTTSGVTPRPQATPANALAQTAPGRTSLPIRLIGTALLSDTKSSIAAIEDLEKSICYPLHVAESLTGKLRLERIEPLKIFFVNLATGTSEYLAAAGDLGHLNQRAYQSPVPSAEVNRGVSRTSENAYRIDHDYLMGLRTNLMELLREARALPVAGPKGIAGYRIDQIRKGSFFQSIGLKDGDVIEGFNGQDTSDVGRALTTLNEIDRLDSVDLNIDRDGRKFVLRYLLH